MLSRIIIVGSNTLTLYTYASTIIALSRGAPRDAYLVSMGERRSSPFSARNLATPFILCLSLVTEDPVA